MSWWFFGIKRYKKCCVDNSTFHLKNKLIWCTRCKIKDTANMTFKYFLIELCANKISLWPLPSEFLRNANWLQPFPVLLIWTLIAAGDKSIKGTVILNVGGCMHQVKWETIDKFPKSRLQKLRYATTQCKYSYVMNFCCFI